jgi:hypothetical protein
MATFRVDRFLRPAVLRSIDPDRLVSFLNLFKDFLLSRGLLLRGKHPLSSAQFDQLVVILGTPNRDTPRELLDSMHLVTEMANARCMDIILTRIDVSELGLSAMSNPTPADVAMQAWISQRHIVEAIHAEESLVRTRSFESFQCMSYDVPEIRDLSSEEHYALEREFAEWFADRRCGHACKVFVVPHTDGTQLIIRRGEPMRREESLEDNDIGSVFYRPLKYDVLIFHRVTGELSIHADSSAQKAIYCRMVGKYFFGNENLFPPSTRYTLAPLSNYGPTALSCGDIEELISVKLVEIQILIGGSQREILIHKARDVFEAFEERQAAFPEEVEPLRAKLEVRFVDSKRPRSVTLCPPNVAIFTRDADSIILEKWMQQRGFIVERRSEKHGNLAKTLGND